MSRQSGFTLIELMIAVAIIGLLAAMSLNSYGAFVDRARRSEVKTWLSAQRKILLSYRIEKGRFPKDISQNRRPDGMEGWMDPWPPTFQLGGTVDYEAWSLPDGGYWIGITWWGPNDVREGGVEADSFYAQHGVPGSIQEVGDDLWVTVARNEPVEP